MVRDLEVRVWEIRGSCPVYREGDIFYIIGGFRLKSAIELCMHSLASLMPFYAALSRGISPREMGLGQEEAYVQCPDPCYLTGGGTATFRLSMRKEC